MLTANQIDVLRSRSEQLLDPIVDFLIEDIARRISEAGQLTGTAAYQIWRAQNLGISQKQLKKEIQKRLKVPMNDVENMLTQAAEKSYNADIYRFPTKRAIPFAANSGLQQILDATVKLAQDDLTNMTQTIGFVGPDGNVRELTQAYQQACDFAFQKVSTGAQDYISAIRDATRNLAKKGIRTIDYESGVHTSLEAAVRRNIMGGMGLMQEQISQQNHDALDCDGWEISAHAASAPDHAPFQGRQYTDKEYKALNNSLVRRIGTLNCGHAAFPIILGVNSPQYTAEELEDMRQENEEGVTFDGKHYTLYEATQRQRKFERAIRDRKRRILIDETVDDKDKLQTDQIRLQVLKQEYARFSKGVGLPMQHARMEKAGFDWKKGKAAESAGSAGKATSSHNMLAKAYTTDGGKIEWPPKGDMLATERYREMRSYAEDRGIYLHGFKKSDVDPHLVFEAIDTAEIVFEKYPELRGSEKRPFSLKLDSHMKSGDFGEVKDGVSHILHLNADAYRSKSALISEYGKLADEGWFVNGTGHNSIVFHEMGHMISDVYGIDGLDVMKKVLNTDSSAEVLMWCKRNLSEYSFQYGGKEIISEMYSAYYGLPNPSKEVVDFVGRCDMIILEWRGKV